MSGLLATYEWNCLPWRTLEVAVFKLQRRIYKASQAGDSRRVHRLQRLLLTSRAAKLLAVRRVTQDNQGKHTAGVDGVKSLGPRQRLALAGRLDLEPTGQPTRRVWIPKPGKTERRALGIPTLYDRAQQALVKLALEAEWEAKFEPNSYGFRPGRSVHDAIGAIFTAIEKQPKYVLDADIAQCFDRIHHGALLDKLGTFPRLRRLIARWLKAGVLEHRVFVATEAGTPQGGVASPLLANIALHGLEEHIRRQFPARISIGPAGERQAIHWKPQVIRYADDLVVLHRDKATIEHCRHRVSDWLADMGLAPSPTKTRIAHTLQVEGGKAGFDFLGFEIRQHVVSRYNSAHGFKTLIKASRQAIGHHYRHLAEIIDRNRAARQENLIGQLNPVIAGWSQYYSAVVSKRTFQKLDYQVYRRLASWARYRHPRQSQHWVVRRYWSVDSGTGWAFRASSGPALRLHASTPIVRHVKVKGHASPFDGHWHYWATRRGAYPGLPRRLATLLKRQNGRCGLCGLFLLPEALVEVHHRDGDHGNPRYSNLTVVHRHCHDRVHGEDKVIAPRAGAHDKSPIH